MSKKTRTNVTKKSAPKKGSPRTAKSPARAAGNAAKSDRLRKAAIAEIAGRLADGRQEHETPSTKEIANTGRPATAAKGKRAKPATPARADRTAKRPSGLDLAATVLASAKGPLNAKAIAERVIAAGWTTSGKTPDATLYAAMLREITGKGAASRFKRVDRGLFAAA